MKLSMRRLLPTELATIVVKRIGSLAKAAVPGLTVIAAIATSAVATATPASAAAYCAFAYNNQATVPIPNQGWASALSTTAGDAGLGAEGCWTRIIITYRLSYTSGKFKARSYQGYENNGTYSVEGVENGKHGSGVWLQANNSGDYIFQRVSNYTEIWYYDRFLGSCSGFNFRSCAFSG